MKLYMFRTVILSIIRNLFTVQAFTAKAYVILVCRQLSSRARMEAVIALAPKGMYAKKTKY